MDEKQNWISISREEQMKLQLKVAEIPVDESESYGFTDEDKKTIMNNLIELGVLARGRTINHQ